MITVVTIYWVWLTGDLTIPHYMGFNQSSYPKYRISASLVIVPNTAMFFFIYLYITNVFNAEMLTTTLLLLQHYYLVCTWFSSVQTDTNTLYYIKKTVLMSQKFSLLSFAMHASPFSLIYLCSGILLGPSHAVNTDSTHVEDDTRKRVVVVLWLCCYRLKSKTTFISTHIT